MAEIVSNLFGIDPAALQQQRQVLDSNQAFRFAQLDPLQRANMAIYQGSAGIGRGINQLLGGDEQLNRATQVRQLASQFDMGTSAGLREFAKTVSPFAPDVGIKASTLADEKDKTNLGLTATQQKIDIESSRQALDKEYKAELAALGPNPTEAQLIAIAAKYASPDALLRSQQDAANRRALLTAKQAEKGLVLTPAQKAADMAFGKDYNDFVAGGGVSTIQKNIQQLDQAILLMENAKKAGKNLSGRAIGLADSSGTLSYLFPEAAQVKDLVGGVAQSNLRQILGGQFAAKEGEQLLARAYNTAQPINDNISRLKALREQISTAANAKIQAVGFYENEGTLAGFKPGVYGVSAATIRGVTPSAEDPLGLRKPQGKK